MDFNPSIPGYVFEHVPTPLASHIDILLSKKLPFDKTTSKKPMPLFQKSRCQR